MITQINPTQNTIISRRFRMVSILAIVYAVVYVVALIASFVLVRLAKNEVIGSDYIVSYNYFTYCLYYGIQIGMFAWLVAAAKHLSSSGKLLKTGGIVGIIGLSLSLIVLIPGILQRFIGYEIIYTPFPTVSYESWGEILMILVSKAPLISAILSWFVPIGLAMCAASFFSYSEKTVKIMAIALIAMIGVERIVEFIPMTVRYFSMSSLLSVMLNLAVNILAAVLFASLAKYEEQAPEQL